MRVRWTALPARVCRPAAGLRSRRRRARRMPALPVHALASPLLLQRRSASWPDRSSLPAAAYGVPAARAPLRCLRIAAKKCPIARMGGEWPCRDSVTGCRASCRRFRISGDLYRPSPFRLSRRAATGALPGPYRPVPALRGSLPCPTGLSPMGRRGCRTATSWSQREWTEPFPNFFPTLPGAPAKPSERVKSRYHAISPTARRVGP